MPERDYAGLCATLDMPFGRMPVLEVDGTKIAGSLNILRYLGIKFGKPKPAVWVTS